eukprot:Blabericola_migrator_1__5928@NODE_299_length_10197_cov_100_341955_g246_i0_p3_GENE_NODE_299_length_10197_cov_100_341955_g246_i0NODE_299_length_10197_cov_100_341955_g246_i0_p3_ORF_typecomplete_len380_score43_51OST3_OST6/PF04756_13/2_1e28Thioredoxin/PF00085_20/0_00032TraF/PF13728_6/0_0036ABC2_membrane/PF01061_24/6_3e02ABC2_membrane/PF01061_24/0_02Thioredoxin_2/PF13098_6/0_14Thioredoxin_2/PF13098_6/4_8e03ABC2_membrane_5/PF13346_6/0_049zinc_ribbon_2/PF13240_6/0_074ABC2_membrane_2/PF12679_7/1_8e03ABC2
MKLATVLLAGVVSAVIRPDFSVLTHTTQEPEQQTNSSARVKELDALTLKAKDGVIAVDEKFVQNYVIPRSHDYTIIMVCTADAKLCPYCGELKRLTGDVSKALRATEARLLDKAGAPVYLAEMSATTHKGLARVFGLQAVPALMLINGDTVQCTTTDGHTIEQCRIAENPELALKSLIQDAKELETVFMRAIGREDILEARRKEQLRKRLLKWGMIFLCVSGTGLYYLETIRQLIIEHRQLIAGLALLSFTFSTSGVIYNLQHNMELFGYNPKKRETVWVAPQGRQQYLGEGFLFSILCVLGSISFYGCSRMIASVATRRKATTRTITLGIATALLLFSIATFEAIQMGLQIKRYVFPTTFFPRGMIRGPVRIDRMYAF